MFNLKDILDQNIEDEDIEELKSPAMAFGQMQMRHLGPVTRRERVFTLLERLSPYLTSVLVLAVLVIIPALLASFSKVGQ